MNLLDQIQFVLVHPSHSGNIGSTARALKNMGLSRLTVVHTDPAIIDGRARALASGAEAILDQAVIVDELSKALSDCHLIFATSARARRIRWPLVTARQCAETIQSRFNHATGSVAIVFGRERTGLTNEELQQSHYHVYVPANPHYPSLNLAACVQVIAYELYQTLGETNAISQREPLGRWPTQNELNYLYDHLEHTLMHIGFLDRNNPRLLMQRLKRLFTNAELDLNDVNILRGILKSVEKASSNQQ